MHITRMAIVGTALLVFGACINLDASRSTATRFYLLESKVTPKTAMGSPSMSSDLALGIGPVSIPPYLDRPQLVTRASGNELRVDEFHQWAEPLRDTILRVTRENLSVLTDGGHVHSYPFRQSVAIDYQITLDLLQFEPNPAGSVTLKSVWRIVERGGRQRVMQRRSVSVQPSRSNDVADVVDAMSTALAALTEEIAQALVDGLPN